MTPTPSPSPRAIIGEAITNMGGRIRKLLLTAAATTLGIASLVATVGISQTVRAQVSDEFDATAATEVWIDDLSPTNPTPAYDTVGLTRLRGITGVTSAGEFITMTNDVQLSAQTFPTIGSDNTITAPLLALDPAAIQASLTTVTATDLHVFEYSSRSVIVGRPLADRLGVDMGRHQGTPVHITVDGIVLQLTGIIENSARNPELLLSAIVPPQTARELWPQDSAIPRVLIATDPGAAAVVADQAPVALAPHDPDRLSASTPIDPKTLRQRVNQNLILLVAVLGAVAIVVGATSIVTSTTASVIERRHEIGLRRAIGARPNHIAMLILTETSTTGAVGGLTGAWLGTLAVVALSLAQQWSPVLSPQIVLLAPPAGFLIGLLAGIPPAHKALTMEPIAALRT